MPLEDRIELDRLLEDAFAPARGRTAGISAARVRARVAWEREVPVGRGWRALSLLGRLGETSLGLGMAAILFAGSLGGVGDPTGSVPPERESELVARITAPLDDSRFLRQLRLGAPVPGPDLGRVSAVRLAGDLATSVSVVRERDRRRDAEAEPAGAAGDAGDERQGLTR